MHVAPPDWELLVCDMAGTAFSDDGLVIEAFRAALLDTGLPDGPELKAALASFDGNRGRSKLDAFRDVLPEERARAANEAFERRYEELVAKVGIKAFPGVEDLFVRLRTAGVRIALITGFAERTRETLVDALGWRDTVDLTLSPSDAGRGRPFPDMILTAALRLQITDMHAVAVVGDTRSDLLAGWRSGAGIVAGVTTGAHTRATLETAPHTHLLDSLAGIETATTTR
ncbi:HAD family hydrolase [Streptomyces rugosispiralis]|uniref:HAD hydrolase-like protein n=1 Tax=Streptomyces rugosispiralis TaxID=2967341 RepID=A0ABT1VAN0_9ACTN|nr:HAD family hydrolase [Streptomyces rugosispiralis]MCQ8193844.1 HAD hydrolase-like protein [Streptomyces rugosispiralis]